MKRVRGVEASAAWWCSCGAHASGDAVTVENIVGEHSAVCPHQPACFSTKPQPSTFTRTVVSKSDVAPASPPGEGTRP